MPAGPAPGRGMPAKPCETRLKPPSAQERAPVSGSMCAATGKESPSRTPRGCYSDNPSPCCAPFSDPGSRFILASAICLLLRGEFLAGMTVGLMLVPGRGSYAALAGTPHHEHFIAPLLPPWWLLLVLPPALAWAPRR